jgi:hypothetical protein
MTLLERIFGKNILKNNPSPNPFLSYERKGERIIVYNI